MKRIRTQRGEEGEFLILALLFMTALIFLALVPLQFADAGLRATLSLRSDRSLQYTAQSALYVAIDEFRVNQTNGEYGAASCIGSGSGALYSPLTFSSGIWQLSLNGDTVQVSCTTNAPPDGVGHLERSASFSVSCVAISAGPTCPTNPLLLTFYDAVNQITPTVRVSNWSSVF